MISIAKGGVGCTYHGLVGVKHVLGLVEHLMFTLPFRSFCAVAMKLV